MYNQIRMRNEVCTGVYQVEGACRIRNKWGRPTYFKYGK